VTSVPEETGALGDAAVAPLPDPDIDAATPATRRLATLPDAAPNQTRRLGSAALRPGPHSPPVAAEFAHRIAE
jgi:hypothetical protein